MNARKALFVLIATISIGGVVLFVWPEDVGPDMATIDGAGVDAFPVRDRTESAPNSTYPSDIGANPATGGSDRVIPVMDQLRSAAPGGVIEDPAAANLLGFATIACSETPEMDVALGTDAAFDESRAWAIAGLIEACSGFDASGFSVQLPKPRLAETYHRAGWVAAEPIARDVLAQSGVSVDLATAGLMMMENGAFPYDQVMPDMRSIHGPTEIMRAMAIASHVVSCERTKACGDGSLQVLAVCANVGCPRGLDYDRAISERLPANEGRLVRAMARWINQQR